MTHPHMETYIQSGRVASATNVHDNDFGEGRWIFFDISNSLIVFERGIVERHTDSTDNRILFSDINYIVSHLDGQTLSEAKQATCSTKLPLDFFCRSVLVKIYVPVVVYSALLQSITSQLLAIYPSKGVGLVRQNKTFRIRVSANSDDQPSGII